MDLSVLDAHVTRYLKRWSGLAMSANTGWLYIPKSDGGLAFPSLSLIYKKLKVSQEMLLLTSSDKVTEEVSKRLICKEEGNKQARFQPMLQSRKVMAAVPGAQRSVLSRQVKMLVSQEDETCLSRSSTAGGNVEGHLSLSR